MKLSQRQWLTILTVIIAAGLYVSCTNNEDFANPLDPENLRTAGSPTGLELTAGDEQVRVSWQDLGLEGVSGYRIYRRFSGDPNSTFALVGEVDASTTEFVDTRDIINDQLGQVYIYRISYMDKNGVEIPDPNAPPGADEDPLRIWPTAGVTPSVPPPEPNVIIGDDLADLTVKLFWQDYQAPDDFEVFRVFAAKPDSQGNFLPFRLVAELPRDKPFFFDQDFNRDEIAAKYRIVAVDKFGAEGVTTLESTSPNLPPIPPRNVRTRFGFRFGSPRYDVLISWSSNPEPDLDGYQIYATVAGGELVPRRKLDAKKKSVTITGEDRILVAQQLVVRQYFITSFDNTPNNGRRDESEMVEALP
ncbi:MAG: hypothetical protein O7E52_21630 [Candidatus Poribacteria bacterium]|nr:hypothetical protein [Candidatus Poribacteria bacterium]